MTAEPGQRTSAATITRGRLLVRNSIWNLAGFGLPLVAAVFSIPPLVDALGTTRFGLLTFVWMVTGYFSLFDLGLGRSLTKLVAERLGRDEEAAVPSLVSTALLLLAALGVLGATALFLLSGWLASSVLDLPGELAGEASVAFRILAVSVPFVVLTSGIRGLFAAYQRFATINAVRIPLGVFTFLGPLAVLPFSTALPPVVAVLCAGRIAVLLVYAALLPRVLPRAARRPARVHLRPLLGFGGWMTVSNLVSPVLMYLDRFAIGVLVSMNAVTFYAVPYEVVTKAWIVPGAVIGVLFPAFATSLVSDRNGTRRIFSRGLVSTFLLLFPPLLALFTFAPEGLAFWLDGEFAARSTTVLRILAVGVLVNSLGQLPFALVQGAGRPDLTAGLHLLELPVYAVVLVWSLLTWGIEGAAVAWTLRVTVDTGVLLFVSGRILEIDGRQLGRFALAGLAVAATFGLAALLEDAVPKTALLSVVVVISSLVLRRLLFVRGIPGADPEQVALRP